MASIFDMRQIAAEQIIYYTRFCWQKTSQCCKAFK